MNVSASRWCTCGVVALGLALLAAPCRTAAQGGPASFTSCQTCVDAGFGWSPAKRKCGGFSTRTCDDEPASGGGAPGGVATPEVEVEAPPAAAAAETPGRCIPAAVHPTFTDEKLGDDDDLLSLMGVKPKCRDMQEVAAQYSDHPYPPRNPQDERRRIVMDPNNTPVALSHMLWGGKRRFSEEGSGTPFRILVAGGGTGDATTMFAQSFTNAGLEFEIVHVDLSAASIGVAKERLQMRGLLSRGNVQFHQGNILEIPSMGLGSFDFVNCIGVLHHMESPLAGLKSLTSMLNYDGGMNLMVYGELGRRGIYDFQDMYRLLGLKRDPALARRIVKDLPSTNWLKRNPDMLQGDFESFGDSGVTDLLLHHCDHAFRVPELLHWLGNAGMRLVEYCDKDYMDQLPESIQDPLVVKRVQKMPWLKRAAFVELARGNVYKHMFYAARDGSDAHSATEGNSRGEVTADSIICRYDYFVNSRTVLPRADLKRCIDQPELRVSFRSEIWNQHRNLPAGITGPLLQELDCKRTVGQLYRAMSKSKKYPHLLPRAEDRVPRGYRGADTEERFVKAVGDVYRALGAHASSREFFITDTPFNIKRPRNPREFARVRFSGPQRRREL